MQFNSCDYNYTGRNNKRYNETNNERIERLYNDNGYKIPSIIYWNVRSSNDVPVEGTDDNKVLLSGFSPSLFNQVIEKLDDLNPEKIFLNTVMSSRYDKVIDAIRPLMEYEQL